MWIDGVEKTERGDALSLSRRLANVGMVNDADRARRIAKKVMSKVEAQALNKQRLQQIRNKMKTDFYASPEVAETIAECLQKEMSLD